MVVADSDFVGADSVAPLHADTLADADRLVANLRSLLALAPAPTGRGPG
ncbi:MAG: hypothetical protein ACKON8_01700 [Planctomycetota bacterium]